jgi:hypothetical protein
VRLALTEASATELAGRSVLLPLGSVDEVNALTACCEVGGELHPDVTDDQVEPDIHRTAITLQLTSREASAMMVAGRATRVLAPPREFGSLPESAFQ